MLKPRDPQDYADKKFLENELEKLKEMVQSYNNQKQWHKNDYLRLFSSPLGVNHLLVGISAHFDISQCMKGRWGKIRKGFALMPIIIEAQQGTWPRYLNTKKSEETIHTFESLIISDSCCHWKDLLFPISQNGNNLVAKAIEEALEYFCLRETQIKILSLAKKSGFRWIGFDAQFIDDNPEGYEIGFKLYDFIGF